MNCINLHYRNNMGLVTMKERAIGLDLIRAIAIVSVVCGHFFSVNTPFNDVPFMGLSMIFQGFLKSIFCNLGVPFFLMLSGYLCCKKEFSIGYYKGLTRVLVSYLIISLITWGILSHGHSLSELIWGVLGFKTIGYAWYLEMYIGLFLLIPFLNIVIKKVNDAGDKRMLYALLLTSMILTALPTMVSRQGHIVLSRYWEMNFPVTFYFLGAYIRMYLPRLSWKYIPISILLLSINLITSILIGGGKLISITGAYYGVVNMMAVYILFVILYPIKKSTRQEADYRCFSLQSGDVFNIVCNR